MLAATGAIMLGSSGDGTYPSAVSPPTDYDSNDSTEHILGELGTSYVIPILCLLTFVGEARSAGSLCGCLHPPLSILTSSPILQVLVFVLGPLVSIYRAACFGGIPFHSSIGTEAAMYKRVWQQFRADVSVSMCLLAKYDWQVLLSVHPCHVAQRLGAQLASPHHRHSAGQTANVRSGTRRRRGKRQSARTHSGQSCSESSPTCRWSSGPWLSPRTS